MVGSPGGLMGEALKPLICNKSKILVLEKLGIGGEA